MEKKPSWVGVNKKKGSPDIITYDKLLNKYIVDQKIGDEVGSDHLPLLFKIHISVIKIKYVNRRKHWILKSFDEEIYKRNARCYSMLIKKWVASLYILAC